MSLLLLLACGTKPGDVVGDDSAADDSGSVDESPDRPSLADAPVRVLGEPSDAAGSAIALADLDGDGLDDPLVSAWFHGRVCLWPGDLAAGDHTRQDAATCFTGPDQAYLGADMAAGDFDGDGDADLLLGAISAETAEVPGGAVFVVPGPMPAGEVLVEGAYASVWGEGSGDMAGWSVVNAGDVDADGDDDLLVGAPKHDAGGAEGGGVYFVRGPLPDAGGALAELADAVFLGLGDEAKAAPPPHGIPASGDGVGYTVDGGADVDGDGLADLVFGASGADAGGSNAGLVAVVLGPVTPGAHFVADADRVWLGSVAEDGAGDTVAAAGDLDGDGLDDVVASGSMAAAGSTWVLTGAGGLVTDAAIRVDGEAGGDLSGAALAGRVDVDGDGAPDLLVGAYGADAGGTDSGAVYLVAGPISAGVHLLADADVRWAGGMAGERAGQAFDVGAGGGVLVGAPYNSVAGVLAGAAYLVDAP